VLQVEFAKKVETWNRKYKSWGCSREPQLSRSPIQVITTATNLNWSIVKLEKD